MPSITSAIDGPIATVTLDLPDGRLGLGESEALAGVGASLAAAEGVRAVVVRSAGTDFGTGWSAAALAEADPAALAAGVEALAALSVPVVAAVRGRAHSAGLEVALACDIRIAAHGSTFALPETGLGLLPRAGGSQRLPRAVGRAAALRMLLTGEEIDAAEARRVGLVSRVVPSEDLDAAARAVAEAIAERGPIATRFAKEAVQRGAEMTLAQALRYELDLTVLLQSTADRAEGVRAFAAKRPPKFIGE